MESFLKLFQCCKYETKLKESFSTFFEEDKEEIDNNKELESPKFLEVPKLILVELDTLICSNNQFIKDTMISFKDFKTVNQISSFDSDVGKILKNKLLLCGPLFYNKRITTEHTGMQEGSRQIRDGKTVFGYTNMKDSSGKFYNDFVVNYQGYNLPQYSETGTLFTITYTQKKNEYQLHNNNPSISIYYVIGQFFYFEMGTSYSFQIGTASLTIQVFINNSMNVIKVELEYNNGYFRSFSFSQDEGPITIGRSDSSIIIPHKNISKHHGIIEFSKETNQFYYRDLKSTNGTILILKEDDKISIKDCMKFRLNQIPFNIMEIP